MDPQVTSALKSADAGTVPVIIQYALPFKHYYDKTDSAAGIYDKKSKFAVARNTVQGLFKGKSRFKQDLPAISGASADIDSDTLQALETNPTVSKISLDGVSRVLLDTSVDQINAKTVWNLDDSNGNPLTGVGMRIAVIDTGVDYLLPDLGGCFGPGCKVMDGWNFISNNSNIMDDMGHGTHVADTAAGKGVAADGTPLFGVAPDARILAYKVCDGGGSCYDSAIIAAINRAIDPNQDGNSSDHVDVMTMSIGGLGGNPDDSMSQAVDAASAAGVVATIAAGNSGPSSSTINSPGTARTAITVAAACKPSQIGSNSACDNGPIASFSSRGPLVWNGVDIQKPDIAAPGVLICAARWDNAFAGQPTCFDDQHIRISGTSMATPHIAGAGRSGPPSVSLVYSATGEDSP